MAQPVTFSGKMPSEDTNGLMPAAGDLLSDPTRQRLVIAIVDVATTSIKHDKGIQVPQLRVRHIELVSDKNAKTAANLLAKELAARTGAQQLPFPHGEHSQPDDFETSDEWADSVEGDRDEGAGPVLGVA